MARLVGFWLVGALALGACSGPQRSETMERADRPMAPAVAKPGGSDSLSPVAFRNMIETVAKEIVSAPGFREGAEAPVIALGDYHNATALRIDRMMVLESVRAEVMRLSSGRIRFRDDAAYAAIIEERARQAVATAAAERSGSRRGDGASRYEQRAAVDGRVIEAAVILAGSAYQIVERDAAHPEWGTTYHQFHFRLVDVKTGAILWEKIVGHTSTGPVVDYVAERKPMLDAAAAGGSSGGFTTKLVK
ncbi:MAG: hypothetical protein FJX47_01965 [Alphaproteobacteria bacterium]|nr:hypothetical protein [Alphaproteobacteria bacterium]